MDIHEINRLPLIDNDQIEMLVEAGEDAAAELIQELLDLFTAESGPHLEALKVAVLTSDFDVASRVGHALAGSSANLGGLRLATLSKAIEHAADSQDLETTSRLAGDIDPLFAETVLGFEREISRIQAAV